MQRTILALLAAWHGLNGAFMLAAGRAWYDMVPGVPGTGPYNPHFVADIGIGFLAAAAGLALAALRPDRRSAALLAPAVFLAGHAGLHLAEFVIHGSTTATVLRDTILIVLPGLAPLPLLFQPVTTQEKKA